MNFNRLNQTNFAASNNALSRNNQLNRAGNNLESSVNRLGNNVRSTLNLAGNTLGNSFNRLGNNVNSTLNSLSANGVNNANLPRNNAALNALNTFNPEVDEFGNDLTQGDNLNVRRAVGADGQLGLTVFPEQPQAPPAQEEPVCVFGPEQLNYERTIELTYSRPRNQVVETDACGNPTAIVQTLTQFVNYRDWQSDGSNNFRNALRSTGEIGVVSNVNDVVNNLNN
jgi:hypothetical protein